MFRVKRRWTELAGDGTTVRMTSADFGSVPEQILFLRKMVDVYRATHWARETALQIISQAGCADRNHACMALAIAEAVQNNVRYIRERPERFQTPPRTWRDRAGDCDDHTTLIATLNEALGIPTEVVGMKVDGAWKHVFSRALIEGKGRPLRLPLDSTLRATPIRSLVNPITKALSRGMRVETLVF